MLSKTIKYFQANLWLNLLLIIILLVTSVNIVYLITYIQHNNVEMQTMLDKEFKMLSEGIDEIKAMETKTFNAVTEYHYLVKEHCVQIEEEALGIQLYITTHYSKVPTEVASIIAHKIVKLCNKYNINISLIMGMMEVESSFNPFAVSKVDARGLMQVMFNVWKKELDLKHKFDLHDIETGIETGIKVVLIYLEMSDNDLTKALQRYNGIAHGSIFSNKIYEAMEKFEKFRYDRECGKDNY